MRRKELLQSLAGETTVLDEEYAVTPGGLRHRALIHLLRPNTRVLRRSDLWQTVSPQTQLLEEVVRRGGFMAPSPLAASAVGGWVSYATWTNDAGTPITLFETSWVVPPEPENQSGQEIYLFNGLQNAAKEYILQPVLQWGIRSGVEGSGAFWTVSSWWVPPAPDGPPIFVPHPVVRVKSGDTLTGRIQAVPRSDSLVDYSCEFVGIPGTKLTKEFQELTNCVEVLEAYGVNDKADYPATQRTKFFGIRVRVGAGVPDLVWDVGGAFPPDVLDNSATAGEVDIVYPT